MTTSIISAEDLFEQLKSIDAPPTEKTFVGIKSRQDELNPLLLKEVASFAESPNIIEQLGSNYIRHVVSLFILAYLRNKDAYRLIIKLISRPGDKIVQLTGEVFTEALGRILASVYDGDLRPIKSVVENANLNPWMRMRHLIV
jgi:hypothetical protein